MGVIFSGCDGWHNYDCQNTECSEHPDMKLKQELEAERKIISGKLNGYEYIELQGLIAAQIEQDTNKDSKEVADDIIRVIDKFMDADQNE